jgi:carbamoyltransferase
MHILGINAYHGDSSACLVKNGVLVAAAEEERFRRIKHWAGFPSESISYCLREAGITLGDVEHIAINSNPRANLWKKFQFTLTNRPNPRLLIDRLRNARERATVQDEFERAFPDQHFRAQVHRIEHHLAHLASCLSVAPFDSATGVSVDGFGDFASAAWGIGNGDAINVEGHVFFPHSLGIFYQALTQYLGFPNYGDEYKIMGLAPYGKPTYVEHMQKIVFPQDDGTFRLNLSYFRHHKEKIPYAWNNGAPSVGRLYTPALEALLGPARQKDQPLEQQHKDIAHSVQVMYERAFFHLLNSLYQRHKLDYLGLAGGCAMNSVANGKIYRNTPFKKVYIQSAAGDAGGAIGAAYVAHHRLRSSGERYLMNHAYLGPAYADDQIEQLLRVRAAELESQKCQVSVVSAEADLCSRSAAFIADGKVVGWFQGRMEWGPRALGNRSILGDPRRADMKDILNRKIKRRESFRPFAPSILREAVPEWFETDDDVPFMMEVFQIRAEKRAIIPAVTHVDGSGRLQTVHHDTNPRYYRLIETFRGLTGVPIVLNTSFNENEPVVCRPEEALDCFLRTKMDVLVLGDWLIVRQ